MNQYVFGAICLAVLIAFGSFYLTNDLGGNSHFDKAGENWKRKWVVTSLNHTLLDYFWSLLDTNNYRAPVVWPYLKTLRQTSNYAIKFG